MPAEGSWLQIPRLCGLDPEDRESLQRAGEVVSFARGDMLLREGDPSSALFAVLRGRIKVVKTTPEGRDSILGLFGPGDLVGAVAVYRDVPYPATAVALKATSCLKITKEKFFRLVESRASLARGLLAELTPRWIDFTERLVDQRSRAEVRYARFFLKLADSPGPDRSDGHLVPIPLSRQELADAMGTTIETSIRIMSRWGKEGIVRTEPRGFILADTEALQRLARG